MAIATAAQAIAGAAAAAAYLDAKFHVRADLAAPTLDGHAPKAQKFMEERFGQNRMMVYHDIERWAKLDRPNHLFLEYAGRSWTYKQFYQDVKRVANWLMNDLGVQPHEMVALVGPNSAEYLMIWFALDAIGACQSFINYNLTGNAMEHSVKLCGCRYVLVESSIVSNVESCKDGLNQADIKIIPYDEQSFSSLTDATPIPGSRTAGHKIDDVRSLIYTSGTTGLPKGVMIMTGRCINTARAMSEYLQLKPTDKFYTCLPLYHGSAHSLCTTPVILSGASMRLGRKFSHSSFWPDVSSSGATHLQYVGELCRYLLNAPVHPLERKHRVQVVWGNGMRPDVWEPFRQRFNIPIVHELYAATDGLGSTFNLNRGDFSRGAIGLRGALWHWRNGGKEVRVRIDPDTEDLVRTKDGWVEQCTVNEPGEVIHRVAPELAAMAFRGYFKNEAASAKRWLRDAFAPGDLWFRSGDVQRQDGDGRVFFVDRLGDTFRWRAENVSTHEVADVLGAWPQLAEVNVYGVAVPHADGRCGCATVVLRDGLDKLDAAGLARHALQRLPRYAVPLFLRVAPALAYTGTFKIQKGTAKREGIDPDLIAQGPGRDDRLLWLPPGATAYQPYEQRDWLALKAGSVKL